MKRGPHQRETSLSIPRLLKVVKNVFSDVKGMFKHKDRKITLCDCLLSAIAMFSLKFPSLLAFDNRRAEPIVQGNLRNLFQVENTPSDTCMREILDQVDPRDIRPAFLKVFHESQRKKTFGAVRIS